MTFTTAADVEKLPRRAKRYDAVDSEMPGVRVRVTPAGAKSFSYLYRIKGERKKRRITLGAVGKIDLAGARKLAKEHAVTAARGIDPAAPFRATRAAERTAKAEKTVAELGALYLEDAAAHNAASTMLDHRSRWRRFVVPAFGSLTAPAIDKKAIAALHRSLRAKPVLANRVVDLLSAFISWCEEQGIRAEGTSPTKRIKKNKERSIIRRLSDDEETRLMRAIDAKVSTANPHSLGAIRFLLYTGWRVSEALSLRWDALDLDDADNAWATLERTKTGMSVRPLAPQVVALLKSLPRTVGHPFVFESPAHPANPKHPKRTLAGGRASSAVSANPPRRRPPGLHPLVSVDYLWGQLRTDAKLEKFRLHDIRHSFVSRMIEAGATDAEAGGAVGHRNRDTTAKYTHPMAKRQREKAAAVVDELLKAGQKKPASVTPISERKKSARIG